MDGVDRLQMCFASWPYIGSRKKKEEGTEDPPRSPASIWTTIKPRFGHCPVSSYDQTECPDYDATQNLGIRHSLHQGYKRRLTPLALLPLLFYASRSFCRFCKVVSRILSCIDKLTRKASWPLTVDRVTWPSRLSSIMQLPSNVPPDERKNWIKQSALYESV